jgi:hypothetical protein
MIAMNKAIDTVMRGLVPRIHALLSGRQDVDGRVEPGHDEQIYGAPA